MKNLLLFLAFATVFAACGGGKAPDQPASTPNSTEEKTPEGAPKYDPNRGLGKWTAENVAIGAALDPAMAEEGSKIQSVKCASCHKLSDEKLVGPGWKGVTQRRKPEWIMNFVTNVDEMIEKDTAAQKMLEVCLVRMPNQNLSDEDARATLEYMRKNDGKN